MGPLPVINGVITPISRVITPGKPIYFRPFIGVITLFITGSGAHLVWEVFYIPGVLEVAKLQGVLDPRSAIKTHT